MKNSFKHIGAWILLGALFDMKYKTKKCTFKTLLDQKDGLVFTFIYLYNFYSDEFEFTYILRT